MNIKFIKIAREVISFCKKGGKLKQADIICHGNVTCPLGTISVNLGKSIYPTDDLEEDAYNLAYEITGLKDGFWHGFDDPETNSETVILTSSDKEDFIIGQKLYNMCNIRGWIYDPEPKHYCDETAHYRCEV